MNVGELIEELKRHPAHEEALIHTSEGWHKIDRVRHENTPMPKPFVPGVEQRPRIGTAIVCQGAK